MNLEDFTRSRLVMFLPTVVTQSIARYGRSSTVWLARDQSLQGQSSTSGSLVALKVMTAIEDSGQNDEVAGLAIPFKLDAFISATQNTTGDNIQAIKDYFIEGLTERTYAFFYELTGPSLRSMTSAPWKMVGSRRLRGSLARKVTKQTAGAVELIHFAGVVHGGS